jgi:hypothetical protein
MSVIAQYLLNGLTPAVVGGTGTTIKYFTDLPLSPAGWLTSNPNVNAPVTNNQQGSTPTTTNNLGGLPVPGRSVLNGSRFNIFASGDITFAAADASGGAGGILIQASTALPGTAPGYTTIGSITANQPVDGVTYPWTISIVLQGTTASGLVQFSYTSVFDGQASVTANGVVTGVSFALEPSFVVVAGVTFPTSNAANTANLYELRVVQE